MKTSFLCGLIVSLLLPLVQGQRISEQKCKEYREKTLQKSSVIPLVLNPTPINFTSFNCSKTVDLIVGGVAAEKGEFPHQALLGYKNADASEEYDFQCGGSLISDRFVLTAAHCMKQSKPKIVRLGEHNLKDDYNDHVDLEIETIIKHPEYNASSSYHDIALVKLRENVRFSRLIRPACLWTGHTLNSSLVVATGFGYTHNDGTKAELLQKVMLDVLNKTECDSQYKQDKKLKKGIIDSQLCVGSIERGKDTCQGDSGGPIQVVTESKGCIYHIVGVTSLGLSQCAVRNSAAIYTRVASYITWIEEQVWPNGS